VAETGSDLDSDWDSGIYLGSCSKLMLMCCTKLLGVVQPVDMKDQVRVAKWAVNAVAEQASAIGMNNCTSTEDEAAAARDTIDSMPLVESSRSENSELALRFVRCWHNSSRHDNFLRSAICSPTSFFS
jgi:hypothetical protein